MKNAAPDTAKLEELEEQVSEYKQLYDEAKQGADVVEEQVHRSVPPPHPAVIYAKN